MYTTALVLNDMRVNSGVLGNKKYMSYINALRYTKWTNKGKLIDNYKYIYMYMKLKFRIQNAWCFEQELRLWEKKSI